MQRKENKYKLFDEKLKNILNHKQRKYIMGIRAYGFFYQKYVIVYFSFIVQLPIEKLPINILNTSLSLKGFIHPIRILGENLIINKARLIIFAYKCPDINIASCYFCLAHHNRMEYILRP